MNTIRAGLVWLALVGLVLLPASASIPNEWATARLPEQGGSAVAIWTGKDKTFLLTAAHCKNTNPIRVQFGVTNGSKTKASKRWAAVDAPRDLALIEMDAGPVPSVAPVASSFAGREGYSWGHDSMVWPKVGFRLTILDTNVRMTTTLETVKPGRSGGPLLNSQGELIGICQGYDVRTKHGIFGSLQAIHSFLKENGYAWLIKGEQPKVEMPSERSLPKPL